MEESGPSAFLLYIDNIHQQSLQKRCQTTSHQHVAGAPDALVQRQTVAQQVTAYHAYRTHHKQGNHLLLYGLTLTYQHTTVESQQHMSHTRDGAYQTLRVNSTLMIQMVVAKQFQVNLSQNVLAGILGIAVAQH